MTGTETAVSAAGLAVEEKLEFFKKCQDEIVSTAKWGITAAAVSSASLIVGAFMLVKGNPTGGPLLIAGLAIGGIAKCYYGVVKENLGSIEGIIKDPTRPDAQETLSPETCHK